MNLTDDYTFTDDRGRAVSMPDGIKAVKRKMGWRARDLAEICHVSPSAAAKWASGERHPSRAALALIKIELEKEGNR